jgi:SAM-dependent methyltransferase
MPGDRWWRGYDAVILDAVAPGARVLEVGCGDGSLVERLAERGLDSLGVDPNAPAHPLLLPQRLEDAELRGELDAVCAVMALHHADLEPVLARITRLLRRGGLLLSYEFSWEDYDERATGWLDAHGDASADNTVAAWRAEHADLHTGAVLQEALRSAFEQVDEAPRPYLARMLGRHELEPAEETLIAAGELPAVGRWYSARAAWKGSVE